MFMITSEDDSRTEIHLSLMDSIYAKPEKGSTAATLHNHSPVSPLRQHPVKIIPVSFKTERTFVHSHSKKSHEMSSESITDPKAFGIGTYHPQRLPKSNYNVTQLFQAVYDGRVEDVSFCLRYIDIHSRDKTGRTPLIAAMFAFQPGKRRKLLQLCIRQGVNLHLRDWEFHRSAFAWGCYLGRCRDLQLLHDALDGDIDCQERDIHGNTYLHLAVLSTDAETVKMLVDYMEKFSLNLDPTNNAGLTPYILARKMGLKEITNILSQKKTLSKEKADDLGFRMPREWSILGQVERSVYQNMRSTSRNRHSSRSVMPTMSEESPRSFVLNSMDFSKDLMTLPSLLEREESERKKFKHQRDSKGGSQPWIHNALMVWSEQNNPQYRKPALPLVAQPLKKNKLSLKSKQKATKKKPAV